MVLTTRKEDEKDLERHRRFVKKKLYGIGGLKIKSFYKVCDQIVSRRIPPRHNRKAVAEFCVVARQLMPYDENTMRTRVCPANAAIYYKKRYFGKGRWTQTVCGIGEGIIGSIEEHKLKMLNGDHPRKSQILAYGIWD